MRRRSKRAYVEETRFFAVCFFFSSCFVFAFCFVYASCFVVVVVKKRESTHVLAPYDSSWLDAVISFRGVSFKFWTHTGTTPVYPKKYLPVRTYTHTHIHTYLPLTEAVLHIRTQIISISYNIICNNCTYRNIYIMKTSFSAAFVLFSSLSDLNLAESVLGDVCCCCCFSASWAHFNLFAHTFIYYILFIVSISFHFIVYVIIMIINIYTFT